MRKERGLRRVHHMKTGRRVERVWKQLMAETQGETQKERLKERLQKQHKKKQKIVQKKKKITHDC